MHIVIYFRNKLMLDGKLYRMQTNLNVTEVVPGHKYQLTFDNGLVANVVKVETD